MSTKEYAQRMARLGTETAFEVLAKARALEAKGKKIIHLQIGEPDFPTPENICEAGIKAIRDGYTHYGPSAGLMSAREVAAEYISETRGIKVEPDEVVVTPGAKPVIFFGILSLVEEGDEVICPNPGYPIYASVANFVGGKVISLPLREEYDFRFDINELKKKITSRTKLLIINSPQNPTGGVLTKEDLKEIAFLAQKNNFWVLSDEVYSRIIYDGVHHSIIAEDGMRERTLLVEGHSKTYAMTGWRLGYGVMPRELAIHITRLMTNACSCTATFTQIAGSEALKGPQESVEKMVAEFRKRRDLIVKLLNEIPRVSCRLPKGAFYVFPNVKAFGRTSKELANFLLEESGVATLAGSDFGEEGEGYLRLSYANSQENIKEGVRRLAEGLKKLK
jgi:aspartate/methionine/tyrosine aminotransferase